MKLFWVLLVFINNQQVSEIAFSDLDTCVEYATKISQQNNQQVIAGSTYVNALCIPKNREEN